MSRMREHIITAASKLFAEKGFDASIADIAKLAEVNDITVYRLFKDKGRLYKAVFAKTVFAKLEPAPFSDVVNAPTSS